MLDEVTGQIKSERQDERSRAIVEWVETKDRTKLKMIAAVYRNVQDPLLLRLAREADTYARNDPHAVTEMPPEDEILLTDAVNTYILGDRVRALDYLNKALRVNPAWKRNPIIADFGAALMQITPEQAVKLLAGPDSEDAFSISKGAGWWQLRRMEAENIRRATEIRNLVILAVSSGAFVTALWWLFTEQWVAHVPLNAAPSFTLPGTNAAAVAQYAGSAFGALVALFVIAGAVSVVDTLLRSWLWHSVSGAFVPGKRPPFLLILHHVIVFHIAFNILSLGALCVLILLSADALSGMAQNRMGEEIAALNARIYVWSVSSLVAYVVLMTRVLMDTYRLEIGNAIILLAIGLIVMALISTAIGFLMGTGFPSVPGIFG